MKLFRSAMFWLFFIVPFSLGLSYLLFYASNQYEAEAHFTIEKHGENQSDPLGALTGLPGSVASTRDALIIKDFIESREVIERTRDDFDIKALYARKDKDWPSRLEQDATIEETLEFWQRKVTVEFDQLSGIVTLNVWAYKPEEAVLVTNAILKESELLVNDLSRKAREDSLVFAKQELTTAENNLKNARTKVRIFRDKENVLSPEKDAESKLKLVEHLEAERANAETNLRTIRLSYPENSPKVKEAKNKVSSIIKQLTMERKRSARNRSAKSSDTMSAVILKYEELLSDQEFAEKSYEASLLNLEKARVDATQQQRYLSIIVQPLLPEEPIRPKAPEDFIVLLLASLIFWGIMSLIIASIRDHAGWL